MIAVWIAIALVAGYVIGRAVWPLLGRRPIASRPTFRGEGEQGSQPRRLEELIEAARAAALRIRVHPDGFDVLSQPPAFQDHVIGVRVFDRNRVTVDKLFLTDTGSYDLIFTVASALVPIYGPITVTEGDGGVFRIDGTLDQHQLRNEKAARVTAKLRDVMSRLRV